MDAASTDPVLNTLLLPFETGGLAWPTQGRILFARARAGTGFSAAQKAALVCEQSFRPDADRLEQAGFTLTAGAEERFPLVLVLPPRQRDESRALFAQALTRVAPGGIVLACVANNQGARSSEEDLRRLAGSVQSLSKSKCRVFWASVDESAVDAPLLEQWAALDAAQRIVDGRFISRPGLFSWDRIDPASQLLADHLPNDLQGRAADLGAGYGYLSSELLSRNPGIVALDLYEAERRALDLARVNLAPAATRTTLGFHWHDVSQGLPKRYDVIVSNPPFHQGRADAPDLGQAFIVAAAAALDPGGCLWLVANRHLPYEAVLAAHFGQSRTVVVEHGFKVIVARNVK